MSKTLNVAVYEKLMKRVRRPTEREIEKMTGFMGKEIIALSLWDGKMQMNKRILKEINYNSIYMPPISIPFNGNYCGILTILHDNDILYEVISEID